jgi:nickel transport system substrate-binding protein
MTASRRIFLKGMLAAPAALSGFSIASVLAQTAGGTLTVAIVKPAGDLNPHKYAGLWGVQDLMFEPLIRYGKNGEMQPCLATEWQLEDGGKRLRLKLRQGVTFQDGEPWNAEAFMWNLDRWIGKDAQNWMNSSRAYQAKKIIDDHTVEIEFKEPVLGLLYELSFIRPSRFLSPKAADKDDNYQSPVGTGPWIQEKAGNDGSSFRRFEGYWGEKPSFERLELKVLPDSRSRMAALRAGEIDLTGGDFLAPLTANEAMTLKNAGIPVTVETGTTTFILGFNPDRNEALKDARVRKAINIGFDRAAIAQVLYQGLAQPAGNLYAETVPMAGKRFDIPVRDVEAAKALLEEAGWKGDAIREKDGKPLAIEIVASEEQIAGSRAVAEVMQAQLQEVGIDLTIRSIDHASRHSDIPARKYDMAFFLTFGAPYEPFGSIIGLFLSTYDNGVDGKLYVDPKNLDPLVTAVMQASEANIESALQNIYGWLHDEAAIAPLLYVPSMWAHSPRVKGFQPPATEYDLPYEGISLSEQG